MVSDPEPPVFSQQIGTAISAEVPPVVSELLSHPLQFGLNSIKSFFLFLVCCPSYHVCIQDNPKQ